MHKACWISPKLPSVNDQLLSEVAENLKILVGRVSQRSLRTVAYPTSVKNVGASLGRLDGTPRPTKHLHVLHVLKGQERKSHLGRTEKKLEDLHA